jgi:DNA-binding PadR family transcriptional regulator
MSESLSDAALLVLVALASGDKHGLAIQADIHSFSGVKVGPGTLYVVLPRLEQAGLIVPLPPEGRRRPYSLTDAGRTVLGRDIARSERVSAAARQRLIGTDQ